MAFASLLPTVAAASPMLAASLLPSSMHALRVLSRSMSSYARIAAPVPSSKPAEAKHDADSSWECLIGPLEKHTVHMRQYEGGVMPLSAVFVSPVVRHSITLMGPRQHHGSNRGHISALLDLATSGKRHYSVLPERPPLATSSGMQHAHSAALTPSDVLPEPRPAVLTALAGKVQPRFKGGVRKLLLRHINRKIIARLARRFTIGIPVVGTYFVSRLLLNDCRRVRNEFAAGNTAVSALFAAAVTADVIDLAAQATIVAGLAHNNFGMGVASAAALLAVADKVSLACAAMSFTSGLSGELLTLQKAAEQGDAASE